MVFHSILLREIVFSKNGTTAVNPVGFLRNTYLSSFFIGIIGLA